MNRAAEWPTWLAIALCGLALACLPFVALAHTAPSGWSYGTACCSGRDCAPIPRERVQVTPGGYLVTLVPGDHPMVKARVQRLFRFMDSDDSNNAAVASEGREKEALPSGDAEFHACVPPAIGSPAGGQIIRCIYVPPEGV